MYKKRGKFYEFLQCMLSQLIGSTIGPDQTSYFKLHLGQKEDSAYKMDTELKLRTCKKKALNEELFIIIW